MSSAPTVSPLLAPQQALSQPPVPIEPLHPATVQAPAVDEPPKDSSGEPLIIDLAQLSYPELQEQHPSLGNPLFFLWLNVLRPLFVAAVWILVSMHLWRYFVTQAASHRAMALVVLGAILVTALFILLRQRSGARSAAEEAAGQPSGMALAKAESTADWQPATLPEIASYARVPRADLFRWQRSRQLRVRHSDSGRLIQAVDLQATRAALRT